MAAQVPIRCIALCIALSPHFIVIALRCISSHLISSLLSIQIPTNTSPSQRIAFYPFHLISTRRFPAQPSLAQPSQAQPSPAQPSPAQPSQAQPSSAPPRARAPPFKPMSCISAILQLLSKVGRSLCTGLVGMEGSTPAGRMSVWGALQHRLA